MVGGVRHLRQAAGAEPGGPTWSFVDGPVTANKTLGVHTAWGRTLKDVFQRYKAFRGFDQRYQNGFDCQGLWIEVGSSASSGSTRSARSRSTGSPSSPSAAARRSSGPPPSSSTARSGSVSGWTGARDYYTFSDTNIEYIWRFLERVHAQGWLYLGHRSTEWCPRCGTSISAHELVGSYEDRTDPSLFVRFPLLDRPGDSLAVWTTTPWTLPANVAAAVHPDEEYGRRGDGEWAAVRRYPDEAFTERLSGSELVGWRYEGPFDHLPAIAEVEHRVILGTRSPWRRARGSSHRTGVWGGGLRALARPRPAGRAAG